MRKEYTYKYFFSKTFQGFGFIVDFENPVHIQDKSYVIDFIFLWFRAWLIIDFYKK